MNKRRILYSALPCTAAAFAGTAYVLYRIAFHSPDRTQNDDLHLPAGPQMEAVKEEAYRLIGELNARPYERVEIRSFDGQKLSGRYYHTKDGAPLAIGFHGYRGTPSRDFSGGAALYIELGSNLLLIEERACCESEGHVISFGVNERKDCLSWIDYAITRFGADVRILLGGISMGAATVLMAAGSEKLPENVCGVIADCPYTTPKSIIRKVIRDCHLPAGPVYAFMRAGARLYGHFDPEDPEADAEEAAKRLRIPVLLIHGEDDRFVPIEMSRKIHAANTEMIEFHTFPDAGHGLSFMVDRPRYERIVREFMGRCLGN